MVTFQAKGFNLKHTKISSIIHHCFLKSVEITTFVLCEFILYGQIYFGSYVIDEFCKNIR